MADEIMEDAEIAVARGTKRKTCEINNDNTYECKRHPTPITQTAKGLNRRIPVSPYDLLKKLREHDVENWKLSVVRVKLTVREDPLFKVSFYLKRSDTFMKLKLTVEEYQFIKARSYYLCYIDPEGYTVLLNSERHWHTAVFGVDNVSTIRVVAVFE